MFGEEKGLTEVGGWGRWGVWGRGGCGVGCNMEV